MEKQEIRKQMKKKRNDMDNQECQKRSAQICQHILQSEVFQKSSYIYAYYPLGNEVDVRSVIQAAWQSGKQVAFPKVFGEQMEFFEISDFSELQPGAFGVMEPEESTPVHWQDVLILTPGVAFDRSGNRMGFGKGYYDRYLEKYFSEKSCCILGISYDFQMIEQLPAEIHDRKMDITVSEKGWNVWERNE